MLKVRIVVFLLLLSSLVKAGAFDEIMKSTKQTRATALKDKVGKLYKLKDVMKYGYINKDVKWVVPTMFIDVGGKKLY